MRKSSVKSVVLRIKPNDESNTPDKKQCSSKKRKRKKNVEWGRTFITKRVFPVMEGTSSHLPPPRFLHTRQLFESGQEGITQTLFVVHPRYSTCNNSLMNDLPSHFVSHPDHLLSWKSYTTPFEKQKQVLKPRRLCHFFTGAGSLDYHSRQE
jgi:hypothetical protein